MQKNKFLKEVRIILKNNNWIENTSEDFKFKKIVYINNRRHFSLIITDDSTKQDNEPSIDLKFYIGKRIYPLSRLDQVLNVSEKEKVNNIIFKVFDEISNLSED